MIDKIHFAKSNLTSKNFESNQFFESIKDFRFVKLVKSTSHAPQTIIFHHKRIKNNINELKKTSQVQEEALLFFSKVIQ